MTVPSQVVDRAMYVCDVEEVVNIHFMAKRDEQFGVYDVIDDIFMCARPDERRNV